MSELGTFQQKLLDYLADERNRVAPDISVIAGDLGVTKQRVWTVLKELRDRKLVDERGLPIKKTARRSTSTNRAVR